MAKAKAITDTDGKHSGWVISCPACKYWHLFDSRWKFNSDVEKPTFAPSMNVNATIHLKYPNAIHCHSFVTDGRIQFLDDCSHDMKGQTVDLGDVDGD
jgi:hypothetical protein